MIKNYLKIALRNLKRNKVYSFINIMGLAIGIACCLLILLFINDELSYDNFHEKGDRIYRVNTDLKFGSTDLALPLCSDMLGSVMKNDYPAIEEYVRLNTWSSKQVKLGDNYYNENYVAYADSTFFKVFTFPAIAGKTNHALTDPNSVVISKSIALRYFGTVDAVGRFLETNDNGSTSYKVTAVIDDMPENSHFKFDFIFPIYGLNYSWGNYVAENFYTYLLLKEGTDLSAFKDYFVEYNDKYVFPYAKEFMNIESKEAFTKAGNKIEQSLTPLKDIHLYSKREQEIKPTGTIDYVYIFSAIAVFILLIACVNFMNLTTARSANRAREVGIRKVLGTERKSIAGQFLIESSIMALLSVITAVVLVLITLPYFNSLSGKNIQTDAMLTTGFILPLILLPVLIGFLAGSYPAFFLSRFMPAEIIKGQLSTGAKSGKLRSALVVFQFASSIVLIIGTIVIYNQLNYIRNKNLGYQKEQLLIIEGAYSLNNIDAFKEEILNYPGVTSATISGYLPVPSWRSFEAFFKERTLGTSGGLTMQRWLIDYDYLSTFGIQLKQGRNFMKEFGTDSSGVILNETAVKYLGLTEPLGTPLYTIMDGGVQRELKVIGVVKDFNYESLRQSVGPLALLLGRNFGNVTFKVSTGDVQGVINKAESMWSTLAQGKVFNYRFADDSFDQVYKAEMRVGKIALTFSILAILVACLGLFGLAAFLAEQKTKEIGLRKVLGASIPSLLIMLSKEFMKWILLANLIAWPLAYYLMNTWLQDYAYRIEISWWVFASAGLISTVIAIITVNYHAVKAASLNPVNALKYE